MSRQGEIVFFTESEESEEGSQSEEEELASEEELSDSDHSDNGKHPTTKREAVEQVERYYNKLLKVWNGDDYDDHWHNINARIEDLGVCIEELKEFASESEEESEEYIRDDILNRSYLDYSKGIQFHVDNMWIPNVIVPPRTSLAHIKKVIEDLDKNDLPKTCREEITYEYCCRILAMKTKAYEETAEMFSSKPMAEKLIRVIEKVDHEYKAELLDRMKSFLKAMEDPLA